MRTYYSTIRPFSRAIRASSFRKLTKQLGDAFADEPTRSLPGDSTIETPRGSLTDAITIDAPADAIWPWLIQMGCLRGGWYSYDWLDNAGIPSASRIMPEFQNLKKGDVLPATPQGEGGFIVLEIKPPELLLLGGCWDANSGATLPPDIKPLPQNYLRSTWAFVLEPQTPRATRLIVRARGDFHAPTASALQIRSMFMGSIHNFMERRQLKNLKRRAEMTQAGE